jgi:hypothetical protein
MDGSLSIKPVMRIARTQPPHSAPAAEVDTDLAAAQSVTAASAAAPPPRYNLAGDALLQQHAGATAVASQARDVLYRAVDVRMRRASQPREAAHRLYARSGTEQNTDAPGRSLERTV